MDIMQKIKSVEGIKILKIKNKYSSIKMTPEN
jgi:hypothetical protein